MKQEINKEQGPCDVQMVTKSSLVKDLFKANEEGSSRVGQPMKPNKEKQEVTSPLKTKMNMENNESKDLVVGPSKGNYGASKGKWKKIAIGKAQKASREI